MENRDYLAELVCMDAYNILRDDAKKALALLRDGNAAEAEAMLSKAIIRSELAYRHKGGLYLDGLL